MLKTAIPRVYDTDIDYWAYGVMVLEHYCQGYVLANFDVERLMNVVYKQTKVRSTGNVSFPCPACSRERSPLTFCDCRKRTSSMLWTIYAGPSRISTITGHTKTTSLTTTKSSLTQLRTRRSSPCYVSAFVGLQTQACSLPVRFHTRYALRL